VEHLDQKAARSLPPVAVRPPFFFLLARGIDFPLHLQYESKIPRATLTHPDLYTHIRQDFANAKPAVGRSVT
jgi:hypothetical protein